MRDMTITEFRKYLHKKKSGVLFYEPLYYKGMRFRESSSYMQLEFKRGLYQVENLCDNEKDAWTEYYKEEYRDKDVFFFQEFDSGSNLTDDDDIYIRVYNSYKELEKVTVLDNI